MYQTAIAEKIRNKRADYVLALKRNQGNLYTEVSEYFAEEEFLKKIKEEGNYKRVQEKAHSQTEIREYYQSQDIKWLTSKNEWKGLKSIAMEKKTLIKESKKSQEYRYFISSLASGIDTLARAVRGHWSIETMHWYLDVTFREDANTTLDKVAAQNHNIIRKWCLSILKPLELSQRKLSLRKKRFVIGMQPVRLLEEVLRF